MKLAAARRGRGVGTLIAVLLAFTYAAVWADPPIEESGPTWPWWPGFGTGDLDGPIQAVLPGPPGMVVVAGDFRMSETMDIPGLAYLEDSQWKPLGTALRGKVRALGRQDGRIVVAGELDEIGDVQVWEEGWSPLGHLAGRVNRLRTMGGDTLYAVGRFQTTPRGEAEYVAHWDGMTWRGRGGNGVHEPAVDFLFHGGHPILATRSGLFLQTGTNWQPYPLPALEAEGTDSGAEVLASHGGLLWIGGNFACDDIQYLGVWDGTRWVAPSGGVDGIVHDVTVTPDGVVVAGDFQRAGGNAARGVALWDGSAWCAVGEGVAGSATRVAVRENTLYVGGWTMGPHPTPDCVLVIGGDGPPPDIPISLFAYWDGALWRRAGQGTNGPVQVLLERGDRLIAGGSFSRAGGALVNHIAAWNGRFWEPLGKGMNDVVWALAEHNGDLYVGGMFTEAGGIPANRVARWNGATWEPLGAGMELPVFALQSHEGLLYAGGAFRQADGQPALHVARWDGGTWQPVGDGLDSWVLDLIPYQGRLIAGGFFRSSGATAVSKVAAWDGMAWRSLDAGFREYENVRVMDVHQEDLILAGSFGESERMPGRNIVRWNSRQWRSFGDGLGGQIYSLQSWRDYLFAGGPFSSEGQLPGRLARWGGAQWRAMPGERGVGLRGPFSAMAVHEGSLFLCVAEGLCRPPSFIARWDGLGHLRLDTRVVNLRSSRHGGSVVVEWETANAGPDFSSFLVYRGTDDEQILVSPRIEASDTAYRFEDVFAPPGATTYWVRGITPEDKLVWLASVHVSHRPPELHVTPNPFRAPGELSIALPEQEPARILVFDAGGRRVAMPLEETVGAGIRSFRWDGTDGRGRPLPAGTYFFLLEAGRYRASTKAIILGFRQGG